MSNPTNYIATSTELTATADAIRAKTGSTIPIEWEADEGFKDAIAAIQTGVDGLKNALCFSSPSSFTLAISDNTKLWSGTLEWTDGVQAWATWDGTTTLTASSGLLYLRGTNNSQISNYAHYFVLTGTNISCNGNIETLLDYATVALGNHPTMNSSCYAYLFQNCTSLISAPKLPATTATNYCYQRMFDGCTNLISAPALPATTVGNYCYSFMFQGCTSLITAPVLPATTMQDSCYRSMFQDCTSLTFAPALPATTLATYCYNQMFQGCTNLISAPALPTTTLATYCYRAMFQDCTSLISPPVLPATTLADYCYYQMFYGCTSLTSIPVLPATTLVDYCYYKMFQGCTNIKVSTTYNSTNYPYAFRIPESGTGTTATLDRQNMFTSTGGTFKSTPTINTIYYLSKPLPIDFTIDGNAAAVDIASGKIAYANGSRIVGTGSPVAGLTNALEFRSASLLKLKISSRGAHWNGTVEWTDGIQPWSVWDGSTELTASGGVLYLRGTNNTHFATSESSSTEFILTGTAISCRGNIETLLDYATVALGQHPVMDAYCFAGLFMGCTSLTSAPALPATTLTDECYAQMFRNCTSLTSAPALPTTTSVPLRCYMEMFRDCTSLTVAPDLPATTLGAACYMNMFYGCTSLTSAPDLPATTLSSGCYYNMFRDCTSLTVAPDLPATTLNNQCYQAMFQGCTSLTVAPDLPATTVGSGLNIATYCYSLMFADCTSLVSAPAISLTTLTTGACEQMFAGCTSLTSIPALPATTLKNSCYNQMFVACTSLKVSATYDATNYPYTFRIPKTGTGTTATNALANMFTNTGGSFTGTPDINTNYYTKNPLIEATA